MTEPWRTTDGGGGGGGGAGRRGDSGAGAEPDPGFLNRPRLRIDAEWAEAGNEIRLRLSNRGARVPAPRTQVELEWTAPNGPPVPLRLDRGLRALPPADAADGAFRVAELVSHLDFDQNNAKTCLVPEPTLRALAPRGFPATLAVTLRPPGHPPVHRRFQVPAPTGPAGAHLDPAPAGVLAWLARRLKTQRSGSP